MSEAQDKAFHVIEMGALLDEALEHHNEVELRNSMMGAQLAACIQRNGGPITFNKVELETLLEGSEVLHSEDLGDKVRISLISEEEATEITQSQQRKKREGMN
jgi:hypothetical protein